MKSSKLPSELTFSLAALAVIVVIVHAVYVLHVRPVASAILKQDQIRIAQDPNYVSDRSFYVLIKDYEQESTIVLMLWALTLLAYKAVSQRDERRALDGDFFKHHIGDDVG